MVKPWYRTTGHSVPPKAKRCKYRRPYIYLRKLRPHKQQRWGGCSLIPLPLYSFSLSDFGIRLFRPQSYINVRNCNVYTQWSHLRLQFRLNFK